MNTEENKLVSYYAVIPANVRYDRRLCASEKLMYGEITALCNESGKCWAKNSYFAKLYDVAPQTVSRWIGNLRKCGYIKVTFTKKENSKEIKERIITLGKLGINKNVNRGINKNVKDNTTSISGNARSKNEQFPLTNNQGDFSDLDFDAELEFLE